ncbi:DUF2071 domain-containing protein [Streptosporangium sp. CA-115845]|uniref:DUF2071 domain-containing protein n=1 Tax=Streptosporangium sp. CA-115845 TaxID=3240071 RepID=UPI003D8E8EF5
MAFNGTPRPSPRWYHARTELDDFAIVSYRVPTGALARLLPEGFAPAEFTFEDGGNGALVSAVAFRDRDFHFRFLPPVAIGCGQINYRAYVTTAGGPGVWTPTGVGGFLLKAGSASQITEFDKWMFRDWWRHLKSRYGR